MSRWAPDARGRLERAALELFTEQGFAETTVPQITERAGLTTRTFFRYFTDKREVLFTNEDGAREQLSDIMRTAPPDLSPMDLLVHALEAAANQIFEPRFDYIRGWRAVVRTDESLRERELRKQQLSTEAALAAFRERGVDEPTADLLARLATLLFQTAVTHWAAQPTNTRPLVAYIHDALTHLRSLLS